MRISLARSQRRRLSMTSLIDVVFLLLLFFMLTSTFSKYTATPVTAASGQAGGVSQTPTLLVRPMSGGWRINGLEMDASSAIAYLGRQHEQGITRAVLSVDQAMTSQGLVDALQTLRSLGFDTVISR
jgi:biopolymer transport protein ExbD